MKTQMVSHAQSDIFVHAFMNRLFGQHSNDTYPILIILMAVTMQWYQKFHQIPVVVTHVEVAGVRRANNFVIGQNTLHLPLQSE